MAAGTTRAEGDILALHHVAPRSGSLGEVFRTAAPFILSSGVGAVKIFSDRLMLAWYSDVSMVAALTGGMAAFLLASPFLGIAAYASSFVSQYHGAGWKSKIGVCVWQSLLISLASGLLVALMGMAVCPVFGTLGHSPGLASEETAYFLALTGGSVLTLAGVSLSCFWTGRGKTWVVLGVNLGALAVSLGLNGILIFGAGRFLPALGILGAAAATLTADGLKAAVLLALFLRRDNRRIYRTRPERLREPAVAGRLLRFGLGNGVQLLLGIGAFSIFHVLMGSYGYDAKNAVIATASGIAFSITSLAGIPLLGLGTAVSLLVAKGLGGGDAEYARRAVRSARILAALYAAGVSLAFLAFPADLIAVFNMTNRVTGETAGLAASFLGMAALFFVADSMSVLYGGAVRGAGDTAFAMKVMAATGCGLFALPCLAAFLLGADAFILWGLAILYAFCTALLYRRRYREGKWERLLIIGGSHENMDIRASISPPVWDR